MVSRRVLFWMFPERSNRRRRAELTRRTRALPSRMRTPASILLKRVSCWAFCRFSSLERWRSVSAQARFAAAKREERARILRRLRMPTQRRAVASEAERRIHIGGFLAEAGCNVSFLVFETIADAAHCIEEAGGGVEFFAQAADVGVHRSCVN